MSRQNASTTTALVVINAVFFMWGLMTVLNDILIPHLKGMFTLSYFQAMLVQFCFFGAYFIMATPWGAVLSRIGYRATIIAGLVLTGIGTALFLPAAAVASYPLFLFAFFVMATGITGLQVAANPYVSLLGEERHASSRLNLAQAFNSVGTVFGPYVIGPMILAGTVLGAAELAKLPAVQQAAYQAAQAKLVEGPYAVLAVVLVVLAVAIWLFRLPPLEAKEEQSAAKDEHSFFDALRHSHVFLGVIAIFLYVGAEVSIGSFLVNYIALPDIGHMSEHDATKYVALYWGGAMIGRFVGAALLKVLDPRKVLGFFAIIASLLVITTMSTHGNVAVTTVVAIGLFNSVMFPTIFTLGIDKMGPLAGKASSLLIMGIVGGALVPLAQGALADHIGVQHAFVLPLLCYLYIMFYGFKGSKVA
ncbi:sugar MFS transporter [Oleiagrimonas sp. C23AA]|uniref:sugar MFS transporter n=1 Tax=Oleiagrimonas sp. C23AA TaxID=2719047 RepID=UPI001423343D|nr:sugar MFS transporter [Oleiagrimonas sp. C23AA]NII09938.1 sugar MFS transporter [Oleiagrimonas sp. C23AA]